MEHKLKLSEIVKYLLLGAISAMLVDLTLLYLYGVNPITFVDVNNISEYVGDGSIAILVGFVALSYLSGLLVHTLNELLVFIYHNSVNRSEHYRVLLKPKYNMQSNTLLRIKYSLSRLLCTLLSPLYYHTIDDVCVRLHDNGKNGEIHQEWIPAWVSLSYRPDSVLKLLAERVSQRNQGVNTEFLYLHEFITGLRTTLLIILLIVVVSLPFMGAVTSTDCILLASLLASWWLLSCVAKVFAIKYIIYIDSCHQVEKHGNEMERNRDEMRSILYNNGLPSAYIMVRTTSATMRDSRSRFADDIARTILSQDYPNITVVVYEDLGEKPATPPPAEREVYTNPIVAKLSGKRHIDVIYCADYLASAAQSSLEIRRVFVNAANADDVAILLDDDDEFATADAVSSIMTRMAQYNADVCMIGYNEVSQRGLSIINNRGDYDDLLQEVSDLNRSVTCDNIPRIYRAATMGWTKCYKRSVLQRYCHMVGYCDRVRASASEASFGDLYAYEDFPDYVTLLFEGCKIVAINQALYNYRKQSNSITATLTRRSFEIERVGFLIYMEQIVRSFRDGVFAPQAEAMLAQFLEYKLAVIENILQQKSDAGEVDFSVEQFREAYCEQRARILKIL